MASRKLGPNIHSDIAVVAANDNDPGSRRTVLLKFQSVQITLDEVAVIDRLMQELPAAANDNITAGSA